MGAAHAVSITRTSPGSLVFGHGAESGGPSDHHWERKRGLHDQRLRFRWQEWQEAVQSVWRGVSASAALLCSSSVCSVDAPARGRTHERTHTRTHARTHTHTHTHERTLKLSFHLILIHKFNMCIDIYMNRFTPTPTHTHTHTQWENSKACKKTCPLLYQTGD